MTFRIVYLPKLVCIGVNFRKFNMDFIVETPNERKWQRRREKKDYKVQLIPNLRNIIRESICFQINNLIVILTKQTLAVMGVDKEGQEIFKKNAIFYFLTGFTENLSLRNKLIILRIFTCSTIYTNLYHYISPAMVLSKLNNIFF